MKNNDLFFRFFIIGGFLTAGLGIIYFLSGESARGTDGQNYSVFVQIVLGAAVMAFGVRKYFDSEASD
jgi:hypothetical protein